MSIEFSGLIKQNIDDNPKEKHTEKLNSVFKRKLGEVEVVKSNILFKQDTGYSSKNARVCFAFIKTDNGMFDNRTKRYALLLVKDTKNIWTTPIFTMSKENFNTVDDMIYSIYNKCLPIMKRLYDINKIDEDNIYITKIENRDPTYIYIIPYESWKGSTTDVNPPLDNKYIELGWFDQKEYRENNNYWANEKFGDKTSEIIKYINNFIDHRRKIFSGKD
jgi:hypothetical protein